MAALFNGAPIVTLDVDILHRRTPENVNRLVGALVELEAVYRNDPRNIVPSAAHFLGSGHQLLRTKHGDLDVLGTIDATVVYEDVLADTIEVELAEIRVLACVTRSRAKSYAVQSSVSAIPNASNGSAWTTASPLHAPTMR